MRFSVITLGCKTNQAESQSISQELIQRGHEEVSLSQSPDICIINTCTVTSKSDYQSRQLIKRALKTGAKVIVTGCYVNRAPGEIKEIGDSISLVENEKKDQIINMFSATTSSKTLNLLYHRSRPAIKIQDGCNKNCSYCIIPKVRGRSRSRDSRDIVKEVKSLEDRGYGEVVLTGINLGSYGFDLTPIFRLEDLIEEIINNTEKIRIRISSLGIREVSSRLIDLMQKSGRICRHLHLSLQSGDNNVLRLMNRNYRQEDFIELVRNLKQNIKDINIGADVIVGFPGEQSINFKNTYDCLERANIGYLHIFPFSKRPGTIAAEMPNQIDNRTKNYRQKLLQELDRRLRNDFYQSQIGRTHKIIVEDTKNGFVRGKTDNYIDVLIPSARIDLKKYQTVDIIIKEITPKGVMGEPLISS